MPSVTPSPLWGNSSAVGLAPVTCGKASSESIDYHIRNLIKRTRENSRNPAYIGDLSAALDAAFILIDANFDLFQSNSFSVELLLQFVEVVCEVYAPGNGRGKYY
jgi:hypothetical protein